jgi:hypothetical protein
VLAAPMEAAMTDEELDQVHKMTIGELFAPSVTDSAANWLKMEKALTQIIAEADEVYHECLGFEFDIRRVALAIAAYAFAPNIDNNAAGNMVSEIALLAHAMLRVQEEGALEWDAPTRVALRKIRRADPEVGEMFDPLGPRPVSSDKPWKDEDLPF